MSQLEIHQAELRQERRDGNRRLVDLERAMGGQRKVALTILIGVIVCLAGLVANLAVVAALGRVINTTK